MQNINVDQKEEDKMSPDFSRKVLVINQYYYPDLAATGQIAAEICSSLAERGMDVHVVTAQPCYTESSPEAPLFEVIDGVHVYRVAMGRFRGRKKMRVRVAGYFRFMWDAWRIARKLVRTNKPDVVLTFSNPPFVGLIGARLSRKYKLKFTYVLHDIHPDILVVTRWANIPHMLVHLWESMNRRIFKAAQTIVVLGDGMKRTLVDKKGVSPDKVKIIPLWARPELTPLSHNQSIRNELNIADGELLLLYSGNMGVMHPLDPILDAASLLKDEPVRFLFVGDGVRRNDLVKRVEEESLSKVSFLPFQPIERFVQLVAASDACLVALMPGMEGLAVPSRSYTFLSAGRPLITIMAPEADIARLITENECGWNATSGQDLAKLIRKLLVNRHELVDRGVKARDLYENRFKKERIIESFTEVLLEK